MTTATLSPCQTGDGQERSHKPGHPDFASSPESFIATVLVALILHLGCMVPAGAQAPPVMETAPVVAPVRTVVERHGMVVAQEARAARIGAAILEQGGNAVDAAVATGFALAVTYPRA